MRTAKATAGGLLVAISLVISGAAAHASDRKSIRLYKLNSKGQFVSQKMVKHGDQPGCHNFFGKRKVNRFAQVGFAWCELFTEKDCAAESQITAKWGGRKYRAVDIDVDEPQDKLYPGSRWLLHPDQNIKISSWRCTIDSSS